MKIIIIGASGTVGKAAIAELKQRHEVISAGFTRGDIQVDITDQNSIDNVFSKIKDIDAIVMTTGKVHFAELTAMTTENYLLGLNNKLMGQINVVTTGMKHLNDNGSFTLTSGILNRDPIKLGASAAMVNGAIDGFVKGAALEMPRGLRINAVSPTVLLEAMGSYGPYFRGYKPVPACDVALAFAKSVEGLQTGQVFCVDA